MIVNNQNQKWETHEVALCHVWNCDRLIRLDQCHTYVKPEWFGSPWADGLDVVAICSHHIVGKNERIEVLDDKPKPFATTSPPLFSPESLQELANILGDDDGAVFAGNTETGTWGHVEPRVQEPEQLKDFVFEQVIDGNDFLYQEWLMDINDGSPHRHIGGAT